MTGIGIGIGIGPFGGKPQTPKGILGSDLFAWWRLDMGVTIGTGISALADQSGNGHSLIQATGASQPAYNAADANFGGLPSMTFDDTDDWLYSDEAASVWDFLGDGSGSTIFFVTNLDGGGVTLSTTTSGVDGIYHNWNHSVAVEMYQQVHDGTNSTNVREELASGTPAVSIARYRSGGAATDHTMRVNKVDGTEAGGGTGDPSAGGAAHTLSIGSLLSASASGPLGGEVAEIIICDAFITDAQVAALETYAARYGL